MRLRKEREENERAEKERIEQVRLAREQILCLSFPSKIFRKIESSAHGVKYNALLYTYMTTYHCFNCKTPINEGDPCVYFVQGKLGDCAFVRIPYSLSGIVCANCASKTIF
jgi:DNA-directed RNA polymerase subunit RPC12/RpoP